MNEWTEISPIPTWINNIAREEIFGQSNQLLNFEKQRRSLKGALLRVAN